MNARDVALAALAALTATTLVSQLLLAGEPNPGYAAFAVFPVAAAAALWTRRRWAPLLVLAAAALMVLPRTVELSFDLVRPGSPAPFGTAAVHVAAVGVAAGAALLMLAGARRDRPAGAPALGGPADDLPGLAEAGDHLLMVTRARRNLVVNGALRPVVTARAGRTRLRLLNATAGDHLRIAAVRAGRPEPLHLVATDGGAVERPVELPELLLAPGERAEVLVDTTQQGRVALTALPYSAGGTRGPASAELRLADLEIPAGLAPVSLPGTLRPVEELDPVAAARRRTLVLGGAADGTFTIDGRGFDHHRTDLQARLDTLEVWDVVNDHTTDHPFHLHTYPVQVLARDGVREPFRAWRDTVNVPAGGTVTLAVPLRGAGGRTVYHCHIASHEDLGMMGVLDVA